MFNRPFGKVLIGFPKFIQRVAFSFPLGWSSVGHAASVLNQCEQFIPLPPMNLLVIVIPALTG